MLLVCVWGQSSEKQRTGKNSKSIRFSRVWRPQIRKKEKNKKFFATKYINCRHRKKEQRIGISPSHFATFEAIKEREKKSRNIMYKENGRRMKESWAWAELSWTETKYGINVHCLHCDFSIFLSSSFNYHIYGLVCDINIDVTRIVGISIAAAPIGGTKILSHESHTEEISYWKFLCTWKWGVRGWSLWQ